MENLVKIIKARNAEIEINKITKEKEKVTSEIKNGTLPQEMKDRMLSDFEADFLNDIRNVKNQYPYECECNVVVKMHGSMLTGKTSEHVPNEDHIVYYCLGCGKWLTKDNIKEDAIVIDLFGHQDALKVGYNTSSALVDYLRAYAEFSYDKMEEIDIKSFVDDIEVMKEKGELIVPEEFVRRK